ncbi:uncharacterized protein G6M90_00g079140 [Metarhizium brunneum]|uniref:Uncharacterized protein n=1 Tax=Metarhizium brunneum TaxID=500148 RepID=A0A7D5Z8L1_9HYPO|nr:hypothetical protein G6M90_00g079140 [Metarhizium brunneum]
MKFTLSSAIFFILAVPWVSARPATPTSATSAVTSVAAPTSTDVVDTSFANIFNLGILTERGADLLHELLNEKHESKPKRSVAVRELALNLRDQLNSGDVDLNKALDDGLKKLNSTTAEVDLNDLKTQGFQLLRERIEAEDFNKLAQKLFHAGTAKITRRETWSWAGFFNGPILRTAAKMGVSVASNLLGRVDLNKVAQNGLSALGNMVGRVDMNQAAGQGASLLGSMLGGIDINNVVKGALGFLFP